MTSFISSRPRLTGALCLLTVSGTLIYFGKRRLNQRCPRVSITDLPRSCACRNLIEGGEVSGQTPWGADKSSLLSSWADHGNKTHWVSSFAALQTEIPISSLANYDTFHRNEGEVKSDKSDTYNLAQNLLAAFLNNPAIAPERWLLDKDIPPLSFTPATLLFGNLNIGAFLLGSWSSARRISIQPDALPPNAPTPVSGFPSNSDVLNTRTDGAGTVLYWMFPRGLVNSVDRAASYGMPWRIMDGGFQEFIVEKVSEDTARVTWVMVECADLYPGGSKTSARNCKKLPWILYELHVLYAQILWYGTLRQLGV
ncbi:hypothetical protein BJX68DRAFT_264012 [Aspergillus pseudodeflectus]|uniref:Uncharacterized protein n=1 Tax=Aspergillus pseudodeflectus TaxID=176178 RepID=A0ABR4KTR7_9EURO